MKVLRESSATRETSRWRDDLGKEHLRDDGKKLRKLHLKNLSLEHENEKLAERLHDILTEARKDATIEYIPGWRIGKGGTVIDCYASSKNDAEKFSSMHGRAVDEARQEKKKQAVNQKLYESIQRAKSAYAVDEVLKDYRHNREMARVLTHKVLTTTLHLGLTDPHKNKHIKTKTKQHVRGHTASSSGIRTADSAFGYRSDDAAGRPATGTGTSVVLPPPSPTLPTADEAAAAGLVRDPRLQQEAEAVAAAQARTAEAMPAAYVDADSRMGAVIDQQQQSQSQSPGPHAATKPGRLGLPSSSSSPALFPSLLPTNSLSATIANSLWDSFTRLPPTLDADPRTRPSTTTGGGKGGRHHQNSTTTSSNNASLFEPIDFNEGAINGGWEKSVTPMIRLGEKVGDRFESWRASTRSVFLRQFPSKKGSGHGKGVVRRPKSSHAGAPYVAAARNNDAPSSSPQRAPATAPTAGWAPEMVQFGYGSPGLFAEGTSSTVLLEDPALLPAADAAEGGGPAPAPRNTVSASGSRPRPHPHPLSASAQKKTERDMVRLREAGWSDDLYGVHTKYNIKTVDVSVKGGRVRVANEVMFGRENVHVF